MVTDEEVRRRFEEEEQAYWKQRDELLKKYEGNWVAIVGGQVVAVADQMNKAAGEAFRKTKSGVMFVALVGEEDVEFRIRRVTTGRVRVGGRTRELNGQTIHYRLHAQTAPGVH